MITIKKIGLHNVGVFEAKTVFNIPTGVTYLYGCNKLADGSGNASGKSTLASSVPELFYDEPIIGLKQDKSKVGTRFVEFHKDDETVKVQRSFKGNKEQLRILVNGAEVKQEKTGRTKSNTKEMLAKLWPLSQEEFKTYGYLDSSIPHPLVWGSTTERKAFFTDFFQLDKLDAERKLFLAEAAKLKRTKAAHKELQATFETLKKDMLSKTERVALEEQEAKLAKQLKKLRKEHEQYQAVAGIIQFEKFAANQIKEIKKLLPDLSEFDAAHEKLKAQVRKAEKQQDQLEEWEDYQRDLLRYKKAIDGLDMSVPIEVLKEQVTAYNRAHAITEEGPPTEPEEVKKPKPLEVDRKALTVEQANLEHKLEHARKFKTGVCSTCGQTVKAESPVKLKEKLEAVNRQLAELDKYDRRLKAYEAYKEAVKEYREEVTRFEAAQKEVKKFADANELYTKRKGLTKPEKVEKPEGVEPIEPLKKRLTVFDQCAPNVDMIEAVQELTDEQRSLTVDASALNRIQDKLSAVRSKLQVHNTVKGRAQEIKARLEKLEEEWQKEKALDLLIDAYSDKNVKRLIIEAICQHLMASLNQYSNIVFKDYRFEFIWGTQIQLLVHRGNKAPTDVRKLSGAESQLFTMILALSLLKFVPTSKRLSLMILDEPTASFAPQSTELFHDLLPHLNQIIPSILVVTPKSSERMIGAHEYTVVRDKTGSKIVKGHPESI